MKKATIFIGVVVIALVFGSILMFQNRDTLFATTSTLDGELYQVPVFGYYRCEMDDGIATAPSGAGEYQSFSEEYIACSETGTLTQDCTVNFLLPTKEEASKAFSYLCVYIGDKSIGVPDGAKCTNTYVQYAFTNTANAGQVKSYHISKNQFIFAKYVETNILDDVIGGVASVEKGAYNIDFYPFHIYMYNLFSSSSGYPVTNPDTQDCTWSGDVSKTNEIIEYISGGDLKDDYGAYTIGVDSLRDPGRQVAFTAGFVSVPAAAYTSIGDDQYCVDSKVYDVVTVRTDQGTYKVAEVSTQNYVRTVECCNDADAIRKFGADYFCNEDLEAEQYTGQDISCSAFDPCPMVGYVPGVDQTVYYQECVSGKCVTDSVKVECISNSDCGYGETCNYDPMNPSVSVCKTQTLIDSCGNGVCEASFSETAQTCAEDCDPDYPDDNTLLYIIIGVLAGVVVLVLGGMAFKGPKRPTLKLS